MIDHAFPGHWYEGADRPSAPSARRLINSMRMRDRIAAALAGVADGGKVGVVVVPSAELADLRYATGDVTVRVAGVLVVDPTGYDTLPPAEQQDVLWWNGKEWE